MAPGSASRSVLLPAAGSFTWPSGWLRRTWPCIRCPHLATAPIATSSFRRPSSYPAACSRLGRHWPPPARSPKVRHQIGAWGPLGRSPKACRRVRISLVKARVGRWVAARLVRRVATPVPHPTLAIYCPSSSGPPAVVASRGESQFRSHRLWRFWEWDSWCLGPCVVGRRGRSEARKALAGFGARRTTGRRDHGSGRGGRSFRVWHLLGDGRPRPMWPAPAECQP